MKYITNPNYSNGLHKFYRVGRGGIIRPVLLEKAALAGMARNAGYAAEKAITGDRGRSRGKERNFFGRRFVSV